MQTAIGPPDGGGDRRRVRQLRKLRRWPKALHLHTTGWLAGLEGVWAEREELLKRVFLAGDLTVTLLALDLSKYSALNGADLIWLKDGLIHSRMGCHLHVPSTDVFKLDLWRGIPRVSY